MDQTMGPHGPELSPVRWNRFSFMHHLTDLGLMLPANPEQYKHLQANAGAAKGAFHRNLFRNLRVTVLQSSPFPSIPCRSPTTPRNFLRQLNVSVLFDSQLAQLPSVVCSLGMSWGRNSAQVPDQSSPSSSAFHVSRAPN